MEKRYLKNNTKCIHAGKYIDEKSKAVNTPIYASTAHLIQNNPENAKYPRCFNTITQLAVSEKICALEGGEKGLVLSSGMAAITTALFTFLKQGDHAIFQDGLYGGTQHFINSELENYGIEKEIISSNDPTDYANAVKENTKLIFIESPTNPLLDIIDLRSIAKLASEHNILTIIDNTFATPINQNPLGLGIDIVIHSGTKYLNGHSDVLCGAVVTSEKLMARILPRAMNHGGVLDINACYLLERGLKTLGIRIERQNQNAQVLADYLNKHPKVKMVYYPSLPDHPGHEIAKAQMHGFGGMLSFELACDGKTARKFVDELKIITSAVSLGGVESITCFPAETSHAELTPEQLQSQGISDSLIRLSVGIEDVEDLIMDVESALSIIS